MASKAPKSARSQKKKVVLDEFNTALIEHKKDLKHMTDKDLCSLAQTYAKQRIIQSTIVPAPQTCDIGNVKGTSVWDDEGARILEFEGLKFSKGKEKSVGFEKGCVLDYAFVKSSKFVC